jgi:hypothetical protein
MGHPDWLRVDGFFNLQPMWEMKPLSTGNCFPLSSPAQWRDLLFRLIDYNQILGLLAQSNATFFNGW